MVIALLLLQARLPIRPSGSSSAPSGGLLHSSDFTYVGAISVPIIDGHNTCTDGVSVYPTGAGYNAGGFGFTYNPATDTFWMRVDVGCNQYNSVMGEIGWVTPLNGVECVRTQAHGGPVSSCTTDLNQGANVQSPNFVMQGKASPASFAAITGTIDQAGSAFTGHSTLFTTELAVGSLLKIEQGSSGHFLYCYVAAIASNTALTCAGYTVTQAGSTAAAAQQSFCGTSGCLLRGLSFPGDGNMYVNGYVNYDGDNVGAPSLYKVTGYSSLPSTTVTGPMQLNVAGAWSAANGGHAGGYLASVPSAWQSSLGGDMVASIWNISINARASWGPPAYSFLKADAAAGPSIGSPISVSGLMAYDSVHPTLGTPQQIDQTSQTQWTDYGSNFASGGVVIPDNTSTLLIENTHTDNPCYGSPTSNLALDRTTDPDGNEYCYVGSAQGPLFSGKGDLSDLAPMADGFSHPPTKRILFYNLNDLAAVKAGSKQPYEVVPYDYWDFTADQFDVQTIHNMAWDASRRYLYMVGDGVDGIGCCYAAPIIYVWHVGTPAAPAPVPLWPFALPLLGLALLTRDWRETIARPGRDL